jgi:hypothetical protein
VALTSLVVQNVWKAARGLRLARYLAESFDGAEMETMMPTLAAPILRSFSVVFMAVSAPWASGWAFAIMGAGSVGAILRHRRAQTSG